MIKVMVYKKLSRRRFVACCVSLLSGLSFIVPGMLGTVSAQASSAPQEESRFTPPKRQSPPPRQRPESRSVPTVRSGPLTQSTPELRRSQETGFYWSSREKSSFSNQRQNSVQSEFSARQKPYGPALPPAQNRQSSMPSGLHRPEAWQPADKQEETRVWRPSGYGPGSSLNSSPSKARSNPEVKRTQPHLSEGWPLSDKQAETRVWRPSGYGPGSSLNSSPSKARSNPEVKRTQPHLPLLGQGNNGSNSSRPKLPLIYESSISNRPPAHERQFLNNWPSSQSPRQPDAIHTPERVPVYRNSLLTQSYQDWNTAWDRSRTGTNNKRLFYRNWCSTLPSKHIVYRHDYVPTPFYQYWPSDNSSYYYWGYGNTQWDPVSKTNVFLMYSPQAPETRVAENTTVIYRDESSVTGATYKIIHPDDENYEAYEGYQDDLSDGKRIATDIQNAWTKGDLPGIAQHLDSDMPVRIYDSGEYLEYISDRSFLTKVRDMMDENGTRSFIIELVRPVRKGEVMLYAKHILDKPTKRAGTLFERYSLERVGKRWLISAYESSTSSILND